MGAKRLAGEGDRRLPASESLIARIVARKLLATDRLVIARSSMVAIDLGCDVGAPYTSNGSKLYAAFECPHQ
jgi:hypothetical protein